MQVLSSWLTNIRQDLILCSQPIDMSQHSIKNVKSPVNKLDAVNKAYIDRIEYKSATGTIPNSVRTDHTLFTFPATKDITSGKIIILWDVGWTVGGWVDFNIESQCLQLSGLALTGFQKVHPLWHFSLVPQLMVEHGIFASTIWNYRKFAL